MTTPCGACGGTGFYRDPLTDTLLDCSKCATFEAGFAAGVEAAAKVVEQNEYDGYGSHVAACVRALSPPREPTPSHAVAPRDYDEVPCVWCLRPGREHLGDHSDCPSPGGTVTRYTAQPCPACAPALPLITTDDAERARYALGALDLCPEHAIRLPCPACSPKEGGK